MKAFGRILVTVALSAVSLLLDAQELRPEGGGESYGTGTNFLVLPPSAFLPEAHSAEYSTGGDGYIYGTAGPAAFFRAPVELPAGARVLSVCGFTNDFSTLTNAAVRFEAREVGDTDATPKTSVFGVGATSPVGTPGYGTTCVDLAGATPLIRKFQDLNGDGLPHYSWYFIGTAAANGVGFGGAVVEWQRQVSAAPGFATFVDVPTPHIYFRAIEALNSSGITQGCGSGQFCPNQSVTRGEMAAFLARALGLHWPR